MKTIAEQRGKRALLLLAACCLMAALLWTKGIRVRAAGGLEMSTAYPGMAVSAGDDLSFSLDFHNGSGAGMTVGLSELSVPEGWEGYFSGSGAQVSRVYAAAGDTSGAVSYELSVPEDAAAGTYQVTLAASGSGDAQATLVLELVVAEQELGGSKFEAQYPDQEGTAGASFSYDTTLSNNSSSVQNYTFSSSAPSGWSVGYSLSEDGSAVNSISLEPKQSQTVTVKVTPAADAKAGEYSVSCSAVSAAESLSVELSATITGSYELDLTTPTGRLSTEANAGKQKEITLTLVNSGNTELQNVALKSSAPDGWTVSFSQSTVDVIEAGSSVEVTAYVTPSEDSLSGDYALTVSASNSDTSDSAEFRISVETETVWGVIGIALILCVAAGVFWVFRKYGRR
ncbi:MAG: NEW3 domain-containing protein [Eubacteriales bacterium]|nr:NEW3 domain-containing protein [Eubacteriales bacterium]